MPTREEYIIEKEHYKKTKKSLLRIISISEESIKLLKEQIKELRPKTENGEKICPHCDCVSMKYEGRTKRWTYMGNRAIDTYVCEICNNKEEDYAGVWTED